MEEHSIKPITVKEDDFAKAKTPQNIESGFLGRCVGVVIYNREKQEACVGHFNQVQVQRKKAHQMLRAVLRENRGAALSVSVGGGFIAPHDDVDSVTESRNYMIKLLIRYGFPLETIDTQWNDGTWCGILNMEVDTATGAVARRWIGPTREDTGQLPY